MNKYSRAIINLKNLKNNIKTIKNLAGNDKKILIPVKCNAYGLGMTQISAYLQKYKLADYLGVAYPFEGIELRKNNIKLPILIFGSIIFKHDYDNIIKYNLTPTVSDLKTAENLNLTGKKHKKKIKIHINIDTGMGRIGLNYETAVKTILTINKMSNLIIEGIYSHLSSADETDKKFTLKQINTFTSIIKELKNNKLEPEYTHLLNSAGIINFKKTEFNMIRPGIMFYGYYPDNKIRKNINLKQGLSLFSRIIFVKQSKKGTPISYGHTYFTRSKEQIATVGIGYGDGINRLLSNSSYFYFNGLKCKIRGRVCMDQIMINIPSKEKAKIGDEVLIFGEAEKSSIRLEKLAEKLHTIPYEILCNLGDRIEKIYID